MPCTAETVADTFAVNPQLVDSWRFDTLQLFCKFKFHNKVSQHNISARAFMANYWCNVFHVYNVPLLASSDDSCGFTCTTIRKCPKFDNEIKPFPSGFLVDFYSLCDPEILDHHSKLGTGKNLLRSRSKEAKISTITSGVHFLLRVEITSNCTVEKISIGWVCTPVVKINIHPHTAIHIA